MPFPAKQPELRLPEKTGRLASFTALLLTALGVVLLSGTATAASGQIYKWVDEAGNVHYGSQKPVDSSVEKVDVNTSMTGVNRGAEALDKLKQAADDEAQKVKEQGIPAQPPVPSLSMKEVKRRCQVARQDLATIQSRGQLRERDEKGNTRYISEQEKQQRIKQAKKQIREYCK